MMEKATGGKAELFLLSIQPQNNLYPALIKSNGKKRLGDEFFFNNTQIIIQDKFKDVFYVSFLNLEHSQVPAFFQQHALLPIPHYIRNGMADERDTKDYQTIYSKNLGSVAAPTAGLHFTTNLMQDLKSKGIETTDITLHVGLGTFSPIKVEYLKMHQMHRESIEITASDYQKICENRDQLIAVGTTSLRALESLYLKSKFMPKYNIDNNSHFDTELFLYPGVHTHSIRGLITNFHLPKSSLFILICSLVGTEMAKKLYAMAIENEYRFFSYGDAMLILRDWDMVLEQREQYVYQ
jgi:S-adenosylmethionine:tRNA ribosyltransferase-isomerase